MGKLKSKNLDYIIVNDVTDPNAGFAKDTNVVTLLSKNGTNQLYPAMSKKELALVLLEAVIEEERLTNDDR
jgi:phosphopantothenoylcysteine decarboxylase/phosphopantothenate--cysteine ligase